MLLDVQEKHETELGKLNGNVNSKNKVDNVVGGESNSAVIFPEICIENKETCSEVIVEKENILNKITEGIISLCSEIFV